MTGTETRPATLGSAQVLQVVVGAVQEPSPRGIAAALSRLVRDGTLAPGTRLPTVRTLGAALGVSPATVSGAWQALAGVGLVQSRGRSGTLVLDTGSAWMPPRYRDLVGVRGDARLDLSTGTPDPLLLPDLGPVLARLGPHTRSSTYLSDPVLPALERHLTASWPYRVEAITVVDGALDAMARSLELLVRFGDRVVVEDPCFPPLMDLLDLLGAERVPTEMDGSGLRPESLDRALRSSPAAIVLQPRAHNPTGISMPPGRAAELAAVVARHPDAEQTVVVEDDHSGMVSASPDVSLGTHLPERVLHIRSFSKSHGPDLRIAALGGPHALVDRIVARRMLGPGWTSRMLQQLLLELLTTSAGLDTVAEAQRAYHYRQREIARVLRLHAPLEVTGDGINMWLPVASESAATLHLAAAGIRVAPGSPFRAAEPTDGDHVRVTVGRLRSDHAAVGAVLAAARIA